MPYLTCVIDGRVVHKRGIAYDVYHGFVDVDGTYLHSISTVSIRRIFASVTLDVDV